MPTREHPTPERGYWAKKEACKKVIQTPLPPRGIGEPDEVVVGGGFYHYAPGPAEDLDAPDPPAPVFEESLDAVRERVRKLIGKVPVPPISTRVHVKIRKLLESDERRRAKFAGQSYVLSWEAPLFDGPVGGRRLRILNALCFALHKAGARPTVSRANEPSIDVQFGAQHMGFEAGACRRAGRRPIFAGAGPRPGGDALRLDLVAGGYEGTNITTWTETAATRLEDRLDEIATEIVVAGEARYREWEISNHAWRVKQGAEMCEERRKQAIVAERRERERLAQIEAAKLDGLLSEARAYPEAEDIRAYVATALQKAEAADAAEVRSWAEWALEVADRRDPIKAGR